MTACRNTVIFCNKDIVEIGPKDVAMLKAAAARSDLKRARLCLHKSHSDKVHEMVIAFCKGSYSRPHRHTDKSESFHIIKGKLLVVLFDDRGKIVRRIKMGPVGSGLTFFYRLSKHLWHMVIPLSSFVVIHETTSGPFVKEQSEFADWSPTYDDETAVKLFLNRIGQ